MENLRYIAGVDTSYYSEPNNSNCGCEDEYEIVVAGLVILEYPSLNVTVCPFGLLTKIYMHKVSLNKGG
ncbi:hypothetical protein AX774_g1974 [Zancudomyces culisetae]|uniref:Uncharacterized protein n=1 Tax=Zancudomyces culisetae TaxID=1213189 RepID=A0A1R1PU79_ZANCU|nr:hypothetical protein AX774_g1974 [Zancudomyces culisetae]|eukprot:OMH84504.1 hypothetical protein AX774_g1974 [Zancudomyces culisetae]